VAARDLFGLHVFALRGHQRQNEGSPADARARGSEELALPSGARFVAAE
jgi:hypothetical protein